MERDLERRIADNEAALRDVNEGIERGQWPGEEDAPIGLRCECARLGCNQLMELTIREYERVREHPRRFIVVPGHELGESESVIQREPSYLVVEKTGEAGERAERTDPRR